MGQNQTRTTSAGAAPAASSREAIFLSSYCLCFISPLSVTIIYRIPLDLGLLALPLLFSLLLVVVYMLSIARSDSDMVLPLEFLPPLPSLTDLLFDIRTDICREGYEAPLRARSDGRLVADVAPSLSSLYLTIEQMDINKRCMHSFRITMHISISGAHIALPVVQLQIDRAYKVRRSHLRNDFASVMRA